MASPAHERRRKLELLERYRSLRLDEILAELAPRAEAEADQDRYPWKGAFRPRDEILDLYRQRKKLDRRFLFDMLLVVLALAAVAVNGKRIIGVFAPRPTQPARPPAVEEPAENGAAPGAGESSEPAPAGDSEPAEG